MPDGEENRPGAGVAQPYQSRQEREERRERLRNKERLLLMKQLGRDEAQRILEGIGDRGIEVVVYRSGDTPAQILGWIEEDIHSCGTQVAGIMERLSRYESALSAVALFDEDDAPIDREAQLLAVLQGVYESLEEASALLTERRPITLWERRVRIAWGAIDTFRTVEEDVDPDTFGEPREHPVPDVERVERAFWDGAGRPPASHPISASAQERKKARDEKRLARIAAAEERRRLKAEKAAKPKGRPGRKPKPKS
jgi:hypothetical protein